MRMAAVAVILAACGGVPGEGEAAKVTSEISPPSQEPVARPRLALAARDLHPEINVFGFGNSLTVGNATLCSYAANWPCDLQAIAGGAYHVEYYAKAGVSTQYLETEVTAADSHLDPLATNILVFWEGTNDIKGGAHPDAAFDRVVKMHADRHAAGWTYTVAVTLPLCDDRHNAVSPYAANNGNFAAFNASMRATWPSFADALVDVDADPYFADRTDPAIRVDGVHFTNAGYLRVATLVREQIASMLASRSR